MLLTAFSFLNMTLADVLDIILVGIIIFLVFRWIRGSQAMSIFLAVVSLFFIRVVSHALGMKMLETIMETLLDVGVLALIVIFQPEIRRFLMSIGNRYRGASERNRFIARLFARGEKSFHGKVLDELTGAIWQMSESKTGALIVFPLHNAMEDIVATGDMVDAAISRRLIMNIFFKNSPLHDGAMIIADDRIRAARCTLPMTEREDIPASYGMRHKAAIGITEQTDASVILVSEETGHICFIRAGVVKIVSDVNELKSILDGSIAENREA
ncbi:MAG: diadenylate cyclase CdaA [Bacteroidales bacterium]|nr:diadenylate cyclase CdaA [Bacteroidales bacterium]